MYKSPIEMIYGELQTQMVQEAENVVMKSIREVGVNVNKDELIKALQYERNQYTKGYEDGKNEVLDKIRDEIEHKREEAYKMFGHELGFDKIAAYDKCLDIIDKYKAESEDNKG